MPLCRKKITIRQSKWPALYGARTEIWYRQRHLVTSPTGFGRVKVVSTLGTGRPKRHFLTTQPVPGRGLSPVALALSNSPNMFCHPFDNGRVVVLNDPTAGAAALCRAFLRHPRRTRTMLVLVDVSGQEPVGMVTHTLDARRVMGCTFTH